jgi:DNA-binding NarL/FixJ family response regulator
MTIKKNQFKNILIQNIDPSPFQKRKYFDEDKLKDLAASIDNEGLIEPIIIRPKNDRYELIAGERRLRAIRTYTAFKTIQARIIDVDDLQARRISAAENLQREDFSAIESIEAIVEIIDAHLIEDDEYAAMGQTPENRLNVLFGKLHSIQNSLDRQSKVPKSGRLLLHKFVQQIEKIFQTLPKRLEWKSFYVHDFPLVREICDDIRKISLENQLNKSQIKAISEIKKTSQQAYQHIVNNTQTSETQKNENKNQSEKSASIVSLKDMSAREIKQAAEKIIKNEIKAKQNLKRSVLDLKLTAKKIVMLRLGIPVDRIAKRLHISQRTIVECSDIIESVRLDLKNEMSVPETAQKNGLPEPLIWHIALENMTDQERFKALNWGLITWDHWYWNDLDYRFGDDWPGRIPAQLIAHTLFYYTRQGQLVFDPMAGGGVVPDVCLAFHRRCWSFDLSDRKDKRPEIEVYQWKAKGMKWPVNSKEKPDLIFFDPPYFKKMASHYSDDSISNLSKDSYLAFFKSFLKLAFNHSKPTTRLAFLNADWRNYQGVPVIDEDERNSILISIYTQIISDAGWKITQYIDCPMSSQRFHPGIVSQMQKKRILGVVRRTLIIARKR